MIINKTPHAINIVDEDGNVIQGFLPVGEPARVKTKITKLPYVIDGIPLVTVEVDQASVVGLPEVAEGVYYIVSQMVYDALSERSDLLVPADLVRDAGGNIIGCRAFTI